MDKQKGFKLKTDAELIEFSKNDPEVFGHIVTRYQKKLFRFVKRTSYFKDEDIEDILQEVFIKIYINLNGYDKSMKFSSWIYRITRNQTIDQIRKNSKNSQVLSLDKNDLGKIIKSTSCPVKDFERKESLEKARLTIGELPEKYREVLVLRFLEEKDYEEIMDILKKPKGTIATLIKRGRRKLENQLNNLYFK